MLPATWTSESDECGILPKSLGPSLQNPSLCHRRVEAQTNTSIVVPDMIYIVQGKSICFPNHVGNG